MSRINLTIDQIVLRGFESADRKALLEGLQSALSQTLADPAKRATRARSRQTPVLKLGQMPVLIGPSANRNLGSRIGGAIGVRVKP